MGWGSSSQSSSPPSKVRLPWVSKRGIWDVPGIVPGCPGPLGAFKKFMQKKFVHIFRSLLKLHNVFTTAFCSQKMFSTRILLLKHCHSLQIGC